jgi:hypothetical protein
METHAYLQCFYAGALPRLLPQVSQLLLQAQGSQDGALRMIFLCHRGTEDQ